MNLIKKLKSHRWDLALAYCGNEESLLEGNLSWKTVLNPDSSRWYADPQILKVDRDSISLLVEEYEYDRAIGRIAELTIDKQSFAIRKMDIILELPTHLSFPAILRNGPGVLVHPENFASGKHFSYEYLDGRLQNPTLMADRPLTDAVTVAFEGKDLMLSTVVPNENGSDLEVFEKKGDLFESIGTVHFADNIARNAGDVVTCNGKYFRVAQICNGHYGEGICIQEMTEGPDGLPGFKEIRRMFPKGPYDGMHTLNYLDGWAVTDLRCYNYPRAHAILSAIKHFGRH